jgi:hypothetical protein
MMYRADFWVVLPCKTIIFNGSTTQKTALNKLLIVHFMLPVITSAFTLLISMD